LARPVFGPRVALIASALTAVYWIFIYFEGELLAPVLLVLLVLAALVVLSSWMNRVTYWNALLAGVLVGALALVRPNTLVLVPVALVWVWWIARRRRDSRRFRLALILFPIAVVVTIAPATIRNYSVTGEFIPITSNAGINFYIGNNPDTDCVSANAPGLGQVTTLSSWTCFDEPAIKAAVEKIVGRPLTSHEVSSFFTDKAWEFIGGHPGKAIEYAGKKALLFWGPAEISNNKVIHYERAHSKVLRFLPGFPVALALAILGLALFIVENRKRTTAGAVTAGRSSRKIELSVLLIGFVGAYFASYLPFFIAGRYRVPVIPVMLIFGAYGIDRVWTFAMAKRWGTAAVWVVVLAAAYGAARVPLVTYEPDLGMWHFDRGDAFRKQGKTEQALDEFRFAADESTKQPAIAQNNLGVALDQMGRSGEAVEHFAKAVEANPRFLDARRNLAAVLLKSNRIAEARVQFEAILRENPSDESARFRLGVCLLRESHYDEALRELSRVLERNPRHLYAQLFTIPHFRMALQLGGENAEIRTELASCLKDAGKRAEAISELERVLATNPNYGPARELLNGLK
ncbi:MAG: tetratricopeptide repeat protein, partial [bacterium]